MPLVKQALRKTVRAKIVDPTKTKAGKLAKEFGEFQKALHGRPARLYSATAQQAGRVRKKILNNGGKEIGEGHPLIIRTDLVKIERGGKTRTRWWARAPCYKGSIWVPAAVAKYQAKEIREKGFQVAIAVGDLRNVRKPRRKGRRRCRRNDRKVHSMPSHRLKGFIRYKALEEGIPLYLVGEAYTSKICRVCGFVNTLVEKRLFRCRGCGLEYNRDLNAAVNMASRSFEYILGDRGSCDAPNPRFAKGCRTARLADLSLWEMIDLTRKMGIKSNITRELGKKGLNAVLEE